MASKKYNQIPKDTITGIVKKVFKGSTLLTATTAEEQEQLLFQFQKNLSKTLSLTIEKKLGESWKSEFYINSSSSYILSVHFALRFNSSNTLCLYHYYTELKPVSTVAELLELKTEIQAVIASEAERYAKLAEEKVKRRKIKALKKTAIVTRLTEFANAEQWAYYIDDSFDKKVKLFLKLSETDRIEIDIPFGNFQNTLQNLPTTIQAIKHLSARDISLKIISEDTDSEDDGDYDDEDAIEWIAPEQPS